MRPRQQLLLLGIGSALMLVGLGPIIPALLDGDTGAWPMTIRVDRDALAFNIVVVVLALAVIAFEVVSITGRTEP